MDVMEFRYGLINHLIKKNGYKTYLEIGTQNSICGSNVRCGFKSGIDPSPIQRLKNDFDCYFEMTSDEFFNQAKNYKVDIVFIDGLHTYNQVRADFCNSANVLNENGCIILHDCLPTTAERAKSFNDGGIWNGDCYRFIQDLEDSGIKFYIADFDQGCAVVYLKDIANKTLHYTNSGLTFQQWESKLKTKNILNSNDIINLSL